MFFIAFIIDIASNMKVAVMKLDQNDKQWIYLLKKSNLMRFKNINKKKLKIIPEFAKAFGKVNAPLPTIKLKIKINPIFFLNFFFN